jgi:NDP-4-keto-2,6-dideoxyhexose 3-C-methyltransferase
MGFEPAINLIPECKEETDYVVNNFFNYADFNQTFGANKKAKVITTIAMFYDLEDPNTFVSELSQCLDLDGIWVNQLSYLPLMLKQKAFDNICHEHIEYYSLSSIIKLLDRHSLEVFDVELNDVNGGSFRLYIKHKYNLGIKGFPGAKERIKKMLASEEQMQINKKIAYDDFAERVKSIKHRLTNFIRYTVKYNKSVYIYGASTKGNTFLQYMGLNNKFIKGAAERNPAKWGKRTVATNIPIVSEVTARAAKPDYFLVLPWHFKQEFLKREIEYLKRGGKMIFPLPQFEIVEYKNKKLISSGNFQTSKVRTSVIPLVLD